MDEREVLWSKYFPQNQGNRHHCNRDENVRLQRSYLDPIFLGIIADFMKALASSPRMAA